MVGDVECGAGAWTPAIVLVMAAVLLVAGLHPRWWASWMAGAADALGLGETRTRIVASPMAVVIQRVGLCVMGVAWALVGVWIVVDGAC